MADILDLRMDAPHLAPIDFARLLVRLTSEHLSEPDKYLVGGSILDFETWFAKEVEKESALFLPTGILANHLAVRCLAGGKSRVLVQAESHLYNDSVDCVQTLSHLALVPLAAGKATFHLEEVEAAIHRATDGPHPVEVGAISIESPVRRMQGEMFDFGEMQRVTEYARSRNIRTHLDGARLFVAAAYSGISPGRYAALFDSVYVSLYKFGAPAGAILAGSRSLIEKVGAARRMFGGDLHQGWPDAVVARHFLGGYVDRLKQAIQTARLLFALLDGNSRLRIEAVPNGTNVYRLHVKGAEPAAYQAQLASRGVLVRTQYGGKEFPGVWLVINESLNRCDPEAVARVFSAALQQ